MLRVAMPPAASLNIEKTIAALEAWCEAPLRAPSKRHSKKKSRGAREVPAGVFDGDPRGDAVTDAILLLRDLRARPKWTDEAEIFVEEVREAKKLVRRVVNRARAVVRVALGETPDLLKRWNVPGMPGVALKNPRTLGRATVTELLRMKAQAHGFITTADAMLVALDAAVGKPPLRRMNANSLIVLHLVCHFRPLFTWSEIATLVIDGRDEVKREKRLKELYRRAVKAEKVPRDASSTSSRRGVRRGARRLRTRARGRAKRG